MQDDFANLQKFIANNYALEELEAKLNEFNPLKVLKVIEMMKNTDSQSLDSTLSDDR